MASQNMIATEFQTNSSKNGVFSKLMTNKWSVVFIMNIIIAVSMFLYAFYDFTQFMGSSDRWNMLQPQILKTLILTIVGTVALTIAALFYFTQSPQKAIYFVIVMSSLSFCLSYGALAIGAISR